VLTPERSIEIQADLLGADIVMQLDQCVSWPAEETAARAAMELSIRWGARSKAAFGARDAQALFGIQQGSTFERLRRESAERLIEIGFDGYALGGLAVGEGHEAMCDTLDFAVPMLPQDRPRYLMGVGKPIDLVEAVALGWTDQPEERPLRRGGRAPRSRQRLSRQPRLFEGLSAPPDPSGGDPRPSAVILAQHRLLPGIDGRDARSHR
jgi:queuine tRNA-ribosyltransferase